MVLLANPPPDPSKLPPAVRAHAERLLPHQRNDVYVVYEHERVNEGAPPRGVTDWLRRLQRVREHSWLATFPPAERQGQHHAALPATPRVSAACNPRSEMHRMYTSHLTPSQRHVWEQ